MQYGDVFTLYIAGRYMTFILNTNLYGVFFNSKPDVASFEVAVQQFTQRCARGSGLCMD